jgi:hypothetical protein
MCWNYFASGHGKGEVDGASALLKRKIRKEQINYDGRKLQTATEIVQFLREQSSRVHAGPSSAHSETKKFFWEIPRLGPDSVDRRDSESGLSRGRFQTDERTIGRCPCRRP